MASGAIDFRISHARKSQLNTLVVLSSRRVVGVTETVWEGFHCPTRSIEAFYGAYFAPKEESDNLKQGTIIVCLRSGAA